MNRYLRWKIDSQTAIRYEEKKIYIYRHDRLNNSFCWSFCWWLKSCTTWDVWKPINNGINYQPQLVQDFSHQQLRSLCREFPSPSPEASTSTDKGGEKLNAPWRKHGWGAFWCFEEGLGVIKLEQWWLVWASKMGQWLNYPDIPETNIAPGNGWLEY